MFLFNKMAESYESKLSDALEKVSSISYFDPNNEVLFDVSCETILLNYFP